MANASTDTFRSLCAELAKTLAEHQRQLEELYHPDNPKAAWLDAAARLLDRAEAALAQSEPVKTPKPIRPDCFEFAMDFLGDPEEAELRNYIEALEAALAQSEPTDDRVGQLEAELERERLRLAACGVAAMADTPESAAKARDVSPEYHSASLDDVIRQIDALMELRAALAQPEPQELTDQEILALSQWHKLSYALSDGSVVYPMQEGTDVKDAVLSFARAVLAQRGSPKVKPVPAAEKPWKRDGWCDVAGCCWFFWPEHVNDNLGDVPVIEPPIWEYRKPEAVELYPFSLPHDAVSLPNSNREENSDD